LDVRYFLGERLAFIEQLTSTFAVSNTSKSERE
jgi:hypothetical protein